MNAIAQGDKRTVGHRAGMFAIGGWRKPDESAKQGAERAKTFEAHRAAHIVYGKVGGAQQFFGFVDAPPHEVLMWSLLVYAAKQPDKVMFPKSNDR